MAALVGPARAEDGAPEEAPSAEPPLAQPEDPLSRYRTQFDVLTDRTIGTTSMPVAFNWRRTHVHLAATGSFLVELNNFNSARGGILTRFPTGGFLVEVGVSYVGVWDTLSSRMLALTPYRQPGRPARLELDLAVAVPLAEGVVTAVPRFFPAVQMVFNAYGGIRYDIYPTGFGHLKPGEVVGAVFSPTLTGTEIDNLEEERLAAMQVDPGRYGLMLGLGNDVYFEQGLFVTPRFLFSLPLLAPASGTRLPLWVDLSLAIGVAL